MKRYNWIRNLLCILFIVILLSQFTFAIGLAPSRTILNFEPGLQHTIQMQAINNEDREIHVRIYVKGDLSEYMYATDERLTLKPREMKNFQVNLKFPEDVEIPGRHDNRIGIVEISGSSTEDGPMIGAVAGVESQLWVEVPYKEKYITAKLGSTNAKSGENVKFTLEVINKGIYNLKRIFAVLNIYDSKNILVKTIETEKKSLNLQETAIFELEMSTTNMGIGNYKVEAVIDYDGLIKKVETDFKIGDFLIEIKDINIAPIVQNSIGEILIALENFWPEEINDLELELKIKNNNNLIDILKSSSNSIEPWGTKTISMYWKSGGNPAGEYLADVTLSYGDKTARMEKVFNIISMEVPRQESPLNFSSITIILAFIILSISILLILKYFKLTIK